MCQLGHNNTAVSYLVQILPILQRINAEINRTRYSWNTFVLIWTQQLKFNCIIFGVIPIYVELYSDAHCPLSICLNVDLLEITRPNHANKIDAQEPKVINLDAAKRENFIENFDVVEAAAIETKQNELLHNSDITKSNINETVVSIGKLFNTCSKETFGEIANTNSYHYNKIKPWFNGECFHARNLYHKCKRKYNKYKSNYYKNI